MIDQLKPEIFPSRFLQNLMATSTECENEKERYRVKNLPLATQNIRSLEHYAGHIMSDDMLDGHSFFWLVREPYRREDLRPLMIWLNGGPGVSSMDGMIMENGPFKVNNDGTALLDNPFGWYKLVDMVYVDQPFGTGFSFATRYLTSSEECARAMRTFLFQFTAIFPEYQGREIWLAGESYAGVYLPYLAHEILRYQQFRLGGLIIGSGWLDPPTQYASQIEYAFQKGLLPEKMKAEFNEMANSCDRSLSAANFQVVSDSTCEQISGNVLARNKEYLNAKDYFNAYNVLVRGAANGMDWPEDVDGVHSYLRRDDVVKALNAHMANDKPWSESNDKVLEALNSDPVAPPIKLIPDLLQKTKIVLFTGDADFLCNYIGLENTIRKLNGYKEVAMRRWMVNQKEMGYGFSRDNLSYISVYNGSHMLGYDQPVAAIEILRGALSGNWGLQKPAKVISKEMVQPEGPYDLMMPILIGVSCLGAILFAAFRIFRPRRRRNDDIEALELLDLERG